MNRLVSEVRGDHSNLPSGKNLQILSVDGKGIGGDPDHHGSLNSKDLILIATGGGRSDRFIKGIVFHELAHLDEALSVTWGNVFLWKRYEFFFDGGHDSWTMRAGDAYTEHLYYRKFAPEYLDKFPAPNVNDAPWRK
ncbi:hypothetical protein [Marinagarivorans algicola]|uniref:hypothetical protein n=1 Tax=Marinagarivorans algicola TaxID=1513270 RepID=UPI003736A9D0